MDKVYLCHKCSGLLTKNTTKLPLYSCSCMSGYIRDGQIPFTELEAWVNVVEDTIRSLKWLEQRQEEGDNVKAERMLDRLQLFAINPPDGVEQWDGTIQPIFEGMGRRKASFEYVDSKIIYTN